MEIEVPFLYRAVVVRPRCRSEETVTLLGREIIGIQELSAAEAPIVARFRPSAPDGQEPLRPNQGPTDYRLVGGGMARPMQMTASLFMRDHGLPRAPATIATLAGHLDAWARLCLQIGQAGRNVDYEWIKDWMSDHSSDVRGPIWDERGFEARRWVSDSREAVLDRIRAAVAPGGGVAFVDGVLQQRSMGPCWVIRSEAKDEARNRFVVRVDAAPELAALNDEQLLHAYGATRRGAALAAGAAIAEATNKPFVGEGKNSCSAEPAMPRQMDDVLALLGAARLTARSMAEIVGKMPTGDIRAYADLLDAIAEARGDLDGPAAHSLLPALRMADDAWARHVGVGRVGSVRNPLRAFELRGVRDPAAVDLPEIGLADLEALGIGKPRAGGR